MIWLFNNKKLLGSVLFAALLEIISFSLCLMGDFSANQVAVNLSIFAMGNSLGWLIGIAIAPYNDQEKTTFTSYAGAVSAFFSGYILSKADALIEEILKPDNVFGSSDLAYFRAYVFGCTAIVSLIVTYVFRKYA